MSEGVSRHLGVWVFGRLESQIGPQQRERKPQTFLFLFQMEQKMLDMNQMDAETKMENERLMKEKQLLEDKLEHSQAFVEDTRSHIESLRKQQKDEKRERAR